MLRDYFLFIFIDIKINLDNFLFLTDHILATAAGNGAVVLWNLNKITKQKKGTYCKPLAPKCTTSIFIQSSGREIFEVNYVAKLMKCLADTSCQVSCKLLLLLF